MQQVLLNVPEDRLSILLETLATLDFVEIVKQANAPMPKTAKKKRWTKEQQEFLDGMKEALNDVELHRQGKIQLKTADELIQELWPA